MKHPEVLLVPALMLADYFLTVPVAIMAVFAPSPFVIGGAPGIAMIFVVHGIWIAKLRGHDDPSDKKT